MSNILYFETLDSTQTYLKEHVNELDDKTVVTTETQTAGRGRFDRQWVSQPGGLYFSVLLKPTKIDFLANVTQLMALCVCQAAEQYAVQIDRRLRKGALKLQIHRLRFGREDGVIPCDSLVIGIRTSRVPAGRHPHAFTRLRDLLTSPVISEKYACSVRVNESRLLPDEINQIGSFHRQKLSKVVKVFGTKKFEKHP